MNREARYRAEIARWDWEGIKRDALENLEPSEYDDEMLEGLTYLGSILSLSPSGKFYLPFACSNLSPCEACHGKGSYPPKSPKRIAKKARKRLDRERKRFRALVAQGKREWGKATKRERKLWRKLERLSAPQTCGLCAGYGSREALEDELWREALEATAEEHGMFITGSEGDGCSILAGISRERADERV